MADQMTSRPAGLQEDHRNRTRGDAGAAPSRRSILAAAVPGALAAVGLLAGCGETGVANGASDPKASSSGRRSPSPSHSPSPSPTPKPPPELPRGGRTLFPAHRLFGYCGLPGAAALGRLGTGDPEQRADEIEERAHAYSGGRTALPVFELLACVADASPGPDGTYRTRTPDDTIGRFHELARKHRAMLLLNIQPGRASVLDEVKALHDWLVHPDVGVALDPEWEMGPGQVPGNTYGYTDGGELNSVAHYLSGLIDDHHLPEKPLVFHEVATSVVGDRGSLRPHPGVVPIMSADGIGSPGLKRATWHRLVRNMPDGLHTGFKLFYDEDTRGGTGLMSPKDVLALRPQPEYVMYE
ncbi:hypothetical protein [Streptomyces sp. TS71-3]|uniref:hypothetical protein n=1 Tax=Streptomyces sp. TS71-3 TaxID=2733862 RepID=UPI001B20701C|nr:hypothetical protein [Streptomyces sp. TS71-3]GHJ36882.1 hypothetical protein Sm713_24910 [Streptomyces sp. TS71-3]